MFPQLPFAAVIGVVFALHRGQFRLSVALLRVPFGPAIVAYFVYTSAFAFPFPVADAVVASLPVG